MISYEMVEKTSALGYKYSIGEFKERMRIPDQYLDTVFYLYRSQEAASSTENAGGTGFLVSIKSEEHPEVQYVYAITNKHVIVDKDEKERAPVIRLNTKMGNHEILAGTKENWLLSEDQDLAITAIGLNANVHKFKTIPTAMFLVQEKEEYKEVGAGSDLFFVGRYTWHQGTEKNIPTVRFGTIAMMPYEPIYYAEYGVHYTNYLCEARSIRGFSGSPTFMYIPPFARRVNGNMTSGTDIFFLGVVSSSFPQKEYIKDGNGKPTDMSVQYNSGIMMVIPAWDILNLINSEPLMKTRKKNDEKIAEEKKKQSPELDYADVEKDFTKKDFMDTLKKVSRKVKG